jgi:FKBP-type peptidyl-prolyl cis-trans isomerase (trigger factor)
MNITKEETGKLTATIRIEIGNDDYAGQVEQTLKEQQKKAAMHGFRPGKVPFGLIKKIYGKSVMLDQINQLLSENLNKYIQDNELKIIGNPLPDREKTAELDLEHQTEFDFYFNIGLMPEFDLKIGDAFQVDYYDIKVTDKMVDEYVHDLQHRLGEHPHHEENEGHDHPEEEGHEHHHEPAELNEDFFKKVFPDQEIKDEKTFREKIREGMEKSLVSESDRFFMNTAIEKLVEATDMELPEDFLKKWLKEGGEEELSDEQVEKQFDNFSKSLRWQLIENKLSKEHGVSVEEIEMRDFVKSYFTGRMVFSPEDTEAQDRLDAIASSVLNNKEEAQRIHEQLFDQKLMEFFKNTFKLKHKKLDYDDFVKLVTEKKEK